MNDLTTARIDVTRSSGGGIAFLMAYGTTLLIAGMLAFWLPVPQAALIILFQGGVALPAAFALERLLGFPPMASDNPLRSLGVQLAMVQVVALPAVIVTYQLDPIYVPAVFAAIGGGHFLPYAWLHRTRIYLILGLGVSLGSWLMMAIWGASAFPYVPLMWGTGLWIAALALRRSAQRLTSAPV